LSASTLQVRNGSLKLSGPDRLALKRVERVRAGQSEQKPPFDKPWCFFDLAEIRLYLGDTEGFLDAAQKGLEQTDANWQVRTFVESLRLLLPAAGELPGLKEGLAKFEALVKK
jgi:hypothetical protein